MIDLDAIRKRDAQLGGLPRPYVTTAELDRRALLAEVDRLRWLIEHGERHFGTLWRRATAADIEFVRRAEPQTKLQLDNAR